MGVGLGTKTDSGVKDVITATEDVIRVLPRAFKRNGALLLP